MTPFFWFDSLELPERVYVVVPWCCGAVVLWCCGAVVLLCLNPESRPESVAQQLNADRKETL
eukprot:scaffold1032_cov223-Pinguiococcus_pyrenoidosus.AAC.7